MPLESSDSAEPPSPDPPKVEAVDENGWPRGFFDQVPGSMPQLQRGPQGEFEERLPLG